MNENFHESLRRGLRSRRSFFLLGVLPFPRNYSRADPFSASRRSRFFDDEWLSCIIKEMMCCRSHPQGLSEKVCTSRVFFSNMLSARPPADIRCTMVFLFRNIINPTQHHDKIVNAAARRLSQHLLVSSLGSIRCRRPVNSGILVGPEKLVWDFFCLGEWDDFFLIVLWLSTIDCLVVLTARKLWCKNSVKIRRGGYHDYI